jgi:hypothetical protein
VVGLLICAGLGLSAQGRGVDLIQFYAAGRLAGSGQLYDFQRIRQTEALYRPMAIPYGRLPVYAGAFKVFSYLPLSVARVAWFAVNLTGLLAFLWLWPFPKDQRIYPLMVLCWSYPAAILLSLGQDIGLFVCFAAAGFWLLRSGRDFAAGLVFALCANKFHLAVPLPLFLVARRNWTALSGGLCGGVILLGLSFALEGWQWPLRLLELSRRFEFSPAPYKMPNLHGVSYWLPFSLAWEVGLAVLALAATYLISRRCEARVAAATALATGLLVSHHAYIYDAVLLIPLLMLAQQERFPAVVQYWSVVLCIPVAYRLLLEPLSSFMAQLAISGFTLVVLLLLSLRSTRVAGCPVCQHER